MPRQLKIGRHRQRVTLFDIPESVIDSFGQPSQVPVTIGTFWAEVRPLRGNEQLNVRQIWPTATHMVTMRWLGSMIPTTADNPQGLIMPQMVLHLGLDNSYLHILFADNIEKRNRMWQLTCKEKIGATA
jgi:head-tail adaptor